MTEGVWQEGLVVRQPCAQRHRDLLALPGHQRVVTLENTKNLNNHCLADLVKVIRYKANQDFKTAKASKVPVYKGTRRHI